MYLLLQPKNLCDLSVEDISSLIMFLSFMSVNLDCHCIVLFLFCDNSFGNIFHVLTYIIYKPL
jgi:hypothetical protein